MGPRNIDDSKLESNETEDQIEELLKPLQSLDIQNNDSDDANTKLSNEKENELSSTISKEKKVIGDEVKIIKTCTNKAAINNINLDPQDNKISSYGNICQKSDEHNGTGKTEDIEDNSTSDMKKSDECGANIPKLMNDKDINPALQEENEEEEKEKEKNPSGSKEENKRGPDFNVEVLSQQINDLQLQDKDDAKAENASSEREYSDEENGTQDSEESVLPKNVVISKNKVYIKRGPCRESRDFYLGARYNPVCNQSFYSNYGIGRPQKPSNYYQHMENDLHMRNEVSNNHIPHSDINLSQGLPYNNNDNINLNLTPNLMKTGMNAKQFPGGEYEQSRNNHFNDNLNYWNQGHIDAECTQTQCTLNNSNLTNVQFQYSDSQDFKKYPAQCLPDFNQVNQEYCYNDSPPPQNARSYSPSNNSSFSPNSYNSLSPSSSSMASMSPQGSSMASMSPQGSSMASMSPQGSSMASMSPLGSSMSPNGPSMSSNSSFMSPNECYYSPTKGFNSFDDSINNFINSQTSPTNEYFTNNTQNQNTLESVFQTIQNVIPVTDESRGEDEGFSKILDDINSTTFEDLDFKDIVTEGYLNIEALEQELVLPEIDLNNDLMEPAAPKFNVVKTNKVSHAKIAIKKLCKEPNFGQAVSRIAPKTNEALCQQDEDGDSFLMICVSKPSDSPSFYENLYALTERLKQIQICCEQVINDGTCEVCGNYDKSQFSTPLSLRNKAGDTAISCAIKTQQVPEVVAYLCDSVSGCKKDITSIFEQGDFFFHRYVTCYPSIGKLIAN